MIQKLLASLALLALVGLVAPVPVEAQPSPPATFSGNASIDGKPAPDGTAIRAFIGAQDCTQAGTPGTVTQGTTALYQVQVLAGSQVAGCGVDGSAVRFTIGGNPAIQTATWKAAPQRLDLTAAAGVPVPGAIATPTSLPTPPVATPTLAGTQTTATTLPPLNRVGSGTPETAVLTSDSPPPQEGAPNASSRPNAVALGAGAAGIVAAGGVITWRNRKGRRKI